MHLSGEDFLCDSLLVQRLPRILCSCLGGCLPPQLLRSALQLLQVCQNWPPSLLELKF